MDEQDHVDVIVAQWNQVMPSVDASSMQVFGRMARLLRHLDHLRVDALSSQYGFKDGEFDVLATLRRSGGACRLTPTQLYRSLMVTSGAMTNRLARLESAKMIERVPDSSDGRSHLVALTPLGKELIERAVFTHTDIQNHVLDPLDKPQRDALAKMLKSLLAALPADVPPAP